MVSQKFAKCYHEQIQDKDDEERSDNWDKNGRRANPSQCPCEEDYTMTHAFDHYDHKPNQKEINDVIAKLEEPGRPSHDCKKPCSWVPTDNWKQWRWFQHETDKSYHVDAFWIYQWHCETGKKKD